MAFVGLSSGYDSGAITASLISQKAQFLTVTVLGREDSDVITARCKLVGAANNLSIQIDKDDIDERKWQEWLKENVEDEPYRITNDAGELLEVGKSVHSDKASLLLSAVCHYAKDAGASVYLSGSGADEIYSDYGHNGHKLFPHSNFGGSFPVNLLGRFPWSSFFASTQAAYLAKEEMVAGSFGMEVRYPFLDLKVVQTFLNLRAEVKNDVYKSVIQSYLEFRDFPVLQGQKIGFGFASKCKPSKLLSLKRFDQSLNRKGSLEV
jgi:asparagine synthetase B (glutamine-hydrolysing)